MSAEVVPVSDTDMLELPAKRARLVSPEADEGSGEKALTPEHIFENLRLRRIVRENHTSTIAQIALMFYRPGDMGLGGHGTGGMPAYERTFDKRGSAIRESDDSSNLLVSVGTTQASVYDNENHGDHLDIMSHFQLPDGSEDMLRCCCWLRVPNDALFAVAGEDQLVHLISLAWTREIRILRGHTGAVIGLQPHPTNHTVVLSVGNDHTVRLWSVLTGSCLGIYNHNGASAARFHPDGKSLFIGSATGDVWKWPVPMLSDDCKEPATFGADHGTQIVAGRRTLGSSVDCMLFAKSNLLVKNTAGKIEYRDLESGTLIRTFVVRHHGVSTSLFDVSYDDKYICAGNSRGEVYIFDIETGKAIRRLAHKRSVRPVTCATFSRDCRSVAYTGEGGFIWRYDYVDDETLAEWEKPDDSATNEDASD
ncbi:hypothetical protein GGF46_003766 [Coemansia sp. RSA 552]|nr:hypothetical protein GGF46_003766 [Coemansia sp. RSA 552]